MLPLIFAASATPLLDGYTCTQAGTMPGPEDFALADDAILLVSSDPRRTPGVSGAIVALNLETQQETPLPLTGRDTCSFHPHGITLQKQADTWHLYVVTHYQETEDPACGLLREKDAPLLDGIEHFTWQNDTLSFVERLQSPLLREPNDLIVTETGTIFVSDNPEFTTLGMLTALTFGRRPSAVLSYTQGAGWSKVAGRLLYANGVLQPSKNWLWVSAYGGHLWGYHLEERQGEQVWVRRGHSRLQGALDNLMVGSDGMLYVAAHPDPFAFLRHAKDPSEIAPSQVFTLAPLDDGWALMKTEVEETGQIQASSTATRLGEKLLISQVFEPGVHVCVAR